jgi:hypothetical protein
MTTVQIEPETAVLAAVHATDEETGPTPEKMNDA